MRFSMQYEIVLVWTHGDWQAQKKTWGTCLASRGYRISCWLICVTLAYVPLVPNFHQWGNQPPRPKDSRAKHEYPHYREMRVCGYDGYEWYEGQPVLTPRSALAPVRPKYSPHGGKSQVRNAFNGVCGYGNWCCHEVNRSLTSQYFV